VAQQAIFFVGVWDPHRGVGHHLYDVTGRQVHGRTDIPFRWQIVDSGLLPPNEPERQGELHLSHINNWTVLTMWDRTGDSRPNSNASFIVKGQHSIEVMKLLAAQHFPAVWERIQRGRDKR
jgi:hypothetical protein